LRHVPLAVAIGEDMLELCPDAVVVSYANPMTAIVRGMRMATGIDVIGLCHGVYHVHGYLADLAGLPQKETSLSGIGVNHCTWITDFRHNGRNAWPRVESALAANPPRIPQPDDPFSGAAPFCWALFDTYGAFPAVLDRHVTEFFPALCRQGAYYGRTLGIDAYPFEQTIARGDAGFAQMVDVAAGKRPLDEQVFDHAPGEHEQLVTILHCLAGEGSGVFSANLPNAGRVPDVPNDAILEGMTLIDRDGPRTLAVGHVPDALRHQIAHRSLIVELIVDAALNGDLALFVQAILVEGSLTLPDEAEALATELVEAHASHLPAFQTVV
jgi:alpha-galactosidase